MLLFQRHRRNLNFWWWHEMELDSFNTSAWLHIFRVAQNYLENGLFGIFRLWCFCFRDTEETSIFDDDTKWNLIASIHRHDYTYSELLKTIIISNLFRHKTYVMQIRMSGKTKPPFGSNHYHLTHSRRSHFQTFHWLFE